MKKTARRRRRKKNRMLPVLIVGICAAAAILIAVSIGRPGLDDPASSRDASSAAASSSDQTTPSPTAEPETRFWGNDIDLSSVQSPQPSSSKFKKWPAEPGFPVPAYDLSSFKAAAGSAKPLTGAVVFLDPGHGGEDLGAVFPRAPIAPEIIESRINLKVAFLLRDLLEDSGAQVILTREDDYFYRLYYRSALVGKFILGDFLDRLDDGSPNRAAVTGYIRAMDDTIKVNDNDDPDGIFFPLGVSQAVKNILDIEGGYDHCIYLSLHCNASETPDTISGTRVFYVSNSMVYKKESVLTKSIVYPEYQNYNDEARLRLSTLIYEKITASLPQMVYTLADGAIQETDYSVIREINLVSALIEMGFVNDTSDRAVLLDDGNLGIYADSIYEAVHDYFCR